MACRSVVQELTACTPALLMMGRELRTPAELAFGRPPDSPDIPPGLEYARRFQDRLESAHMFAQGQQQSAGVRQIRNYDVRVQGRHFLPGELVWVYNPQRKKGRCPEGCGILRENSQQEMQRHGCENSVLAARTFHTPQELKRRTPGNSSKGPPTATHVTRPKHSAPAGSFLNTPTSH